MTYRGVHRFGLHQLLHQVLFDLVDLCACIWRGTHLIEQLIGFAGIELAECYVGIVQLMCGNRKEQWRRARAKASHD